MRTMVIFHLKKLKNPSGSLSQIWVFWETNTYEWSGNIK